MNTSDLNLLTQQLQNLLNNSTPIAFARELKRGKLDRLSNRKLAKLAGCGETHVRNMLMLLRLSHRIQAKIEAGAPYRHFLAMIKKFDSDRKKTANAAAKTASALASEGGAKALRKWCGLLTVAGGYAEQCLGDVKALILSAEQDHILKDSKVLWHGTPEAAFKANFPAGYAELRGIDKLNSAIRCIARALVTLIPNTEARYLALELALDDPQLHGGW